MDDRVDDVAEALRHAATSIEVEASSIRIEDILEHSRKIRRATRAPGRTIRLGWAFLVLALVGAAVLSVEFSHLRSGARPTSGPLHSQKPVAHAELGRSLNLPSDIRNPSFLAIQGHTAWVATGGSGGNDPRSLIDRIDLDTGHVEVQSSVAGAMSSMSVSGDDLWLTVVSLDNSSAGSVKLLNATDLRVEEIVPAHDLVAVSATPNGAYVSFTTSTNEVGVARVEDNKLHVISTITGDQTGGFEACGHEALIPVLVPGKNGLNDRIYELQLDTGRFEDFWDMPGGGTTDVDCTGSTPGAVITANTGVFELGPSGQVTKLKDSPGYGQEIASSAGLLWTAELVGSIPKLSKVVLYGDSTGVSAPVWITLGLYTNFNNVGPVAEGHNLWLCEDGKLLQVMVSVSTKSSTTVTTHNR